MRKFLLDIFVFSFIFLACLVLFFTFIDSRGWSDCNYKHFRTSGQNSLVVGTSRAAQAIIPSVINQRLDSLGISLPIYNFSFNVKESPFGQVYYKSIKKKMGENQSRNSIFVICVDPYSLSDTAEELSEPHNRREYGGVVDKVQMFFRPQIFYLLRYCRPNKWKNRYYEELHDDGWLQINAEMDSVSVALRTEVKIKDYNSINLIKSDYRIFWLKETIRLFKQNGHVFMARIPMSDEIKKWEDGQWADFNSDMEVISKELNIRFFDFTNFNSQYQTTDGNHICKDDAPKFTSALCDSIIVNL